TNFGTAFQPYRAIIEFDQPPPVQMAIQADDGRGGTAVQTYNIAVSTATHFAINGPASVAAGAPVLVTVAALDQSNAADTAYSGTIHFTSSDSQATLPGNMTLVGGIGTFTATLKTAGTQTLTASDTATPSIGGGGSVIVSAGALNHFVVSAAPGSVTA